MYSYRLRGTIITVGEAFDGTVTLLHQGRGLPYRLLAEGEPAAHRDPEVTAAIMPWRARAQSRKASAVMGGA